MILSSTWKSHNFVFRWAIYDNDIGTKKMKTTKIQFLRWWLHLFRSSCTPLFTERAHLIFYLKNLGKSLIRTKIRVRNPILSFCNFTLDACKWGCPRTIPETYHSSIGPWPTLLTHPDPKSNMRQLDNMINPFLSWSWIGLLTLVCCWECQVYDVDHTCSSCAPHCSVPTCWRHALCELLSTSCSSSRSLWCAPEEKTK